MDRRLTSPHTLVKVSTALEDHILDVMCFSEPQTRLPIVLCSSKLSHFNLNPMFVCQTPDALTLFR